jgi:hypothetical protein
MTAVALYRPQMSWTLALLLATSLLSVVAYDSARRDCQTRNNYLTDELGNILTDELGNGLTDGTRTRECQLVVGNARFPLPAWAE